tara:strand:+ start:2705 stop:3463 length:759 start_codon:yes stop_codon:yes gene_type:complete
MKKKEKYTSKAYRLRGDQKPLTYMLSSRNNKRSPLLYFDEEKGINRPLRYARNQKSPFEDEQDGTAILEPVVFEDGLLSVQKNNQVLQSFLHYHPQNGMVFEEINQEADAARDLRVVEKELDAQILAKELSTDKLIMVCRVLMGANSERLTIPELKRDVLVYAKNEPGEFMSIINDPMLDLQDTIYQFFNTQLLVMRNTNKDVYFNLPKNKNKLLTVPYGEDHVYITASYMQSDEGIETFKLLKKYLNKKEK